MGTAGFSDVAYGQGISGETCVYAAGIMFGYERYADGLCGVCGLEKIR